MSLSEEHITRVVACSIVGHDWETTNRFDPRHVSACSRCKRIRYPRFWLLEDGPNDFHRRDDKVPAESAAVIRQHVMKVGDGWYIDDR